jgi:hypothetical protein
MNWRAVDELFTRTVRVSGLAGVCWETIVEHVDRPYLLFLFACMLGLARWDSIADMVVKNRDKEAS